MRMDELRTGGSPEDEVEFVKGCPICEKSDAELERILQEFAEWLYGVMRADQKKQREAERSDDIDKGKSAHTLKERSANNQHNGE